MSIKLEVCVDTADGLVAAVAGGADRIELCSALSVGGLTPSPGLMRIAAKASIPVYALIRPRQGDFVFSPGDIDHMRRDIDAVHEAGLAGVVLGASEPRGKLDAEVLLRLTTHAKGLGTTLHRAFDVVPDPFEALELAASLGFERILTSGGERRADENLPLLAELVRRAGERISIMPGSSVRLENLTWILEETGAHEIHSSCSSDRLDVAPEAVRLGFAAGATIAMTSEEIVAQFREALLAFENRPL